MKRSGRFVKGFVGLAAMLAGASMAHADITFSNGDFETGDLRDWTITGQTPGFATTVGVAGQTSYSGAGQPIAQVVNPGLDPRTGNVVNSVYGGSKSVKVGDEFLWGGGNYQYNKISQTQTVTGSTPGSLFFAWAAVAEISGHSRLDTPFFEVHVKNVTKGVDIYNVAHYETDGAFWTNAGTGWLYSTGNNAAKPGWQVENLDLGALGVDVGDVLQLEAIARDCNPTGHAMYVYLDGFGDVIPDSTVPDGGSTAALLGLGLLGAIGLRRKM